MDASSRETITRIIQSCVYGNLSTIAVDGRSPRVRPVCAFLQADLTILVPSHLETRKIRELERNPEVEICFVDAEHWQVRVQGTVERVDDIAVKKHLMESTLHPKLWHGFFPEGPTDRRFVLYRIRPRAFEWMKEWELKYRRVELEARP
jgi:general stress protein 26